MKQQANKIWFQAAKVEDLPFDGSICIEYKSAQIAIFNFASLGKLYATQNMCPHKQQMLLGRGMLGDSGGTPKVACPMHKKTFNLEDGSCLNGDLPAIETFPVKVEDGYLLVELPDDAESIARPHKEAC